MTVPPPLLKWSRRTYWSATRGTWRVRRGWLVARVRLIALLRHAQVEVEVAPDVIVGRRVRVEIQPGTRSRLVVRDSAGLHDDLLIWLRSGTFEIGPRTVLRRGATVIVGGDLRVGEDALVSYGAVLHCAQSLRIGDMAVVAEYATVTDSAHRRTRDLPLLHHVRAAPTVIGHNAWVGAHAVITHGVEVGDRAIVGAHAVVTSDVPPQCLAAGVPARLVRELDVDEDAEDVLA